MSLYRTLIAAAHLVLLSTNNASAARVKFTNLQCKELDSSFASMKQCSLKAKNRDEVTLNIHAVLHKTPVDNASLSAVVFPKTNGYRYPIFNNTGDLCLFVKKPSSFLLWNLVYTEVIRYSNINHSCPYDHDIIVSDMVVTDNVLKLIPFLSRQYLVVLKFAAYNRNRVELRIFVTITS